MSVDNKVSVYISNFNLVENNEIVQSFNFCNQFRLQLIFTCVNNNKIFLLIDLSYLFESEKYFFFYIRKRDS